MRTPNLLKPQNPIKDSLKNYLIRRKRRGQTLLVCLLSVLITIGLVTLISEANQLYAYYNQARPIFKSNLLGNQFSIASTTKENFQISGDLDPGASPSSTMHSLLEIASKDDNDTFDRTTDSLEALRDKVDTLAPSSTALSNAIWTDTRATYLDYLNTDLKYLVSTALGTPASGSIGDKIKEILADTSDSQPKFGNVSDYSNAYPSGDSLFKALKDIRDTLSGTLTLSGSLTTAGNIETTSGVFSGDGSSITNLNASNIASGTLSTDRYSAYDDLTAEGKIGASSGQLMPGDTDNWVDTTGDTLTGALYFAGGTDYYVDNSGNAKFKSLETAGDINLGTGSETIDNTGFAMDGNDLFVAGMAGIEGNVYTDGAFVAGSSTAYGNNSIESSSALNINMTNNQPITTGTGLTTLGGNLIVNGTGTSSIAGNLEIGGGWTGSTEGDTGVTITSNGDIKLDGNIYQTGNLYTVDAIRYTGNLEVANNLKVGVGADGTNTDYLSITEDGEIESNKSISIYIDKDNDSIENFTIKSPNGNIFILDESGNLTLNGNLTGSGALGTSSSRWSTVYGANGNFSGNLTLNGNILDANSNELLKFSSTDSAVNELTIANAASGNSPILSATGGDTNIDITLTPKGTGGVKISNGTITSGVADAKNAIGFTLQTPEYVTAEPETYTGQKLLSIKNGDTEKFALDKDGNITTGVWQGAPITNDYIAGIDQNLLTTSSPTLQD